MIVRSTTIPTGSSPSVRPVTRVPWSTLPIQSRIATLNRPGPVGIRTVCGVSGPEPVNGSTVTSIGALVGLKTVIGLVGRVVEPSARD